MVKQYVVEYLPAAMEDLDNIFNYIADADPEVAATLILEIDQNVSHLERFPEMGVIPKITRLAKKGYRVLIVGDYLIFYVLLNNLIEIRRVFSGKMNYKKLL